MAVFNPGINPFLKLQDIGSDLSGNITVWNWEHDLRVTENSWEQTPLAYKEVDYPCSFFNADGEFSAWIKDYLPEDWNSWKEQIPLSFRQSVGRLSGHDPRFPQLLLLRLMKLHAHFAEWVHNLAKANEGSYLKLLLTLAHYPKQSLPIKEAMLLNFVGQSRLQYVMRLSGVPLKKFDIKYISKLALLNQLWSVQEAREFLWNLSEEPQFKQALKEAEHVNLHSLDKLLKLPKWLWIGSIWNAVAHLDESRIEQMIPPLILEAEGKVQQAARKALSKVHSYIHLEQTLSKLVNRFAKDAVFAEPPLISSASLTAITTGKQLIQEGQKMQHCVGGYVSEVMKGKNYFYHWHGDKRFPRELNVELRKRSHSSQWWLFHAAGFNNAEPTQRHFDYLKQQLAQLNPPWGYLSLKTDIVGLGYYDFAQVYQELEVFQALNLQAEPDNEFDDKAVAVLTLEDVKLGFIPQEKNAVIHEYWDKGFQLKR
ncbi:hypothetical protein THIOSC15_1510002 [uncultured Thiomicrorhabdus sp.]